MSEQNASTEAANSSEETGTQQERTEQEPNWQKRFEDTQSAYTQNQQELSRQRQEAETLRQRDEHYQTFLTTEDPDARREAAEALGFDYEEPEPVNGVDPELARLMREHEELKAWRDEVTKTNQQQAIFDRDVQHVGAALTQAFGDTLNEKQVQFLGDAAWQRRDPESGLPDIESVIADYKSFLDDNSAAKPRPRAPHISGNGQAATHTPQLDTRAQRADYIGEQIAALEADD